MNPQLLPDAEGRAKQLATALLSVFEVLDRVSADPKAVIPYTLGELALLDIARRLVHPLPPAGQSTEGAGKDGGQ